MNIDQIQRKIDRLADERKTVLRLYKQEKQALREAQQHLADVEESQRIAQVVAQSIQMQAHKQLAGVVSIALKTVFGDDYQFRIDFLRKRGRTEAKLVLLKNGHEVGDPLEQESGGVIDLCGFSLRIAALLLQKPSVRKIIILDEPFKFVSADYQEKVTRLLTSLSHKFGTQFIVVTHIPAYETGTVVRL